VRKLVIAALTLGVLITMAALRAADLRWIRAETLRAAESRAENLALIIAAYLGETFAAGDASLRQLALHSRRVGGPAAQARNWTPSLASAKAGLTNIGAITVLDRDGIIRHSTRPEIVGQSRRNEYMMQRALDAPDEALLIGTPFRSLVPPFQLLIPIGRRLTTEDDVVDGLVAASFVPAVPQRFFRSVDVGERGIVWVFHPDGVVLFSEPSTVNRIGQSARNNTIFQAASRRGGSGRLHEPLEAGGPVLLSAFHTMTTPPLVVSVSLDREEALAEWQHEAAASAAQFGAAAVTLVGTLVILFWQMDAKARAERALVDTQQLESIRLRDANDRLASALEREQHARRDAEAASALKDEFLMMVSHELRTPLTAIYGWTRMLVAGAVGERQRDGALRTIERNARAQARLIDDLLDVSASAGGKLRLDMRMVEVASVVEDAVETVTAAAEAKGIRIRSVIDPAAGRVGGDTDRLQQIVWNLLSNAVKFTPAGGRIEVAATRTGSDVEIVVSDTGVGISPEFLPHVFERFRQEDAGTKRRYGGLGLGLAIVRNLVELHGGSVSAHSDGLNRGARFVVRLPAPTLVPAEDGVPAIRPQVPGALRLDGIRVLVVDDDPEARTLFATILEGAGATVTAASSARDALEAFRRSTHDVLVSDIEMPDVDGYGLLREALAIAHGRNERLMAVSVTAYSRPEDQARSLAAGFHRHVQKPVDPAALVAVVVSVWNDTMRGSA
jgi:signal transduction histidine kinase/ActR/RegA family two-component response regulator